ncbi:MAG: polymerase sigma factor, sigma-70 family [Phycisphaerales bacterium]|nr:polymerase sigma factor, sigma-70 family [Phycisphaerales bacterium]
MDPVERALEKVLVVKCQMGDSAALESLFLRHNRPLGYYLRRLLDRDDVGDVQQEVWLAVVRRIRTLRVPEAFTVWLYRIARTKALDRLSDRRLAPLDDGPACSEHSRRADTLVDDHEPDLSAADAADIHAAMKTLRPEHREVLALRFMEDLSYEQIAEVVGCNLGTVRSRLHYAKLALRQQLEKRS